MIEKKLAAEGLVLPAPIQLPPNVKLAFPWTRRHGDRVILSGHGPLLPDGSLAPPFGKVGAEVTPEDAYRAARLTGLAMLASLKALLGDLDRVGAWLRVFGMVNTSPGYTGYPMVINGFSDLVVSLYGEDRGRHARSAIGVAGLPFGLPVEIEAEIAVLD